MGSRQVSRTAIVATTPEKIFGLLADPAQHPGIPGAFDFTMRAIILF